MTGHIRSLTEGTPVKLIVRFALPLMLGNVFQQLYTVVDTMVVGKGLGVDALAAIGAVDWLYWMFLGIIQGLTQGFGILMAQRFGARSYEELRRVVGNSATLAAAGAVLLVAAGQLLAVPCLVLLQTPQAVMGNSLLYLRTMFFGLPIVMAYNLLASVLRSLGDGRTPLYAMIVAALTNIGLDLLFVLVFRWGIFGAAFATLIAQLFSCLFCLWRIRGIELLQLEKRHLRLQLSLARQLLGLGTPMGLMNMIIAVGGMIVQSVVNGFGVIFMAGIVATNKLYGVLEIAAVSYGYAMTTYVGQNLGAERLDRIKQGMKAACGVALLTSAAIAAVMLLLGRQIVSLFISGEAGDVQRAIDVGYGYLSVMSICLPVLYLLYVFRAALQGLGNSVLPMVSGIVEFIMRTAAAMTIPLLLGETGIFYAEVLAWLGADLILLPGYYLVLRKVERKTNGKV